MNVSVLTTCSRNAGGLFYSVRWLSKALAEEGCNMEVFSPRDEYTHEDLGAWDPLPVEVYPSFGSLQFSPRLRRKLAAGNADLVHLHGIWMDNQWAASQWQARTDHPVVVSPRGMLDPWALGNSAWKKKLAGLLFVNKALRQASCIHALCRSEADSIRAYGLDNPIAVLPNAVELPGLEPRSRPKECKTLLFLGRIHPKKGVGELLDAWHGFGGKWKLLVAGWDDGGHEPHLKAKAAAMGLENVEFIGSKYGSEKDRLLRSVDAFVLPSFSEGLPMSVLEAWSHGLPVVMTDHCNLPEGFAAGAAIRVEPNPDSILQGLEALASMEGTELAAVGAAGRALVEEKFTWPKVAAGMRSVYEWCVGGGHPPECMEFVDG